ncbi:hypothetical protein LCGC14_1955480, partial [marine sediment metagenome]
LLNVNFGNLGGGFGFWAADTTPDNEIKSVKWSDKMDKTVKGKWPPKDGELFNQPDLRPECSRRRFALLGPTESFPWAFWGCGVFVLFVLL